MSIQHLKSIKHTNKRVEAFKLLFPGLAITFLIIIVPLVMMVYLSMTSFEMGQLWADRKFVGLTNYIKLFNGDNYVFYHSLWLTVKYVVIVVASSLIIGLGISTVLTNEKLKFRPLVMVFLLVPIVTSTPVVGLSWRLMFHMQNGVLNYFLQLVGVEPINWLGKDWAFFSIIVATLWRSASFMGLVLTAGMQTIPNDIREAAYVDGATGIKTYLYITLPLLKPIILTGVLLQTIESIKQFGVVFILTGGGPGNTTELLSLHLHKQALAYNGFVGKGATIAVVLTIISLVASATLIRTMYSTNEVKG